MCGLNEVKGMELIMEKFSYALEFYYRKIFDLKNVDLFSKKVNEATKVENYFSKKNS